MRRKQTCDMEPTASLAPSQPRVTPGHRSGSRPSTSKPFTILTRASGKAMKRAVVCVVAFLTMATEVVAGAAKVMGLSRVSQTAMSRRLLSEKNVVTNKSDSRDSYAFRVEMDQFIITIDPPLQEYTYTATIHEWVEKTFFDQLFYETGGMIESFHLANIDLVKESDELDVIEGPVGLPRGTNAIHVQKGVAMFKSNDYASAELNDMARDIVDESLLDEEIIPEELKYLSSATYVSVKPPESEEEPGPDRTSVEGVQGGITSNKGRSINQLVIGGVVGGLALVVLALGLALWSRRRGHERNQKEGASGSIETVEADDDEIGSDLGDEVDDVTSMETGRYVVQNMPPSDESEGPSDQASIGSWTLSTFATNSRSILTTESFERDRQTTQLKKDMIGTTEWSAAYGDRSPPRAGALKDTVLQASHFSTSDAVTGEENYKKSSPTKRSTTGESTKEHSTPPFLFTSNGEEIYLMPPSQTRSTRLVSYEPAQHPPPSPRVGSKLQRAKRSALRDNQRWSAA